MESRLIYESDKTYSSRIEWEKSGESEWKFLDKEPSEKNLKNVLNYFQEKKLYIARGRNDSKEIDRTELYKAIKTLHGYENFKVWTKNFRRYAEFSVNGVYRRGEVKENKTEFFLARILKFFVELI